MGPVKNITNEEDISMDIKMGPKCFPEIRELAEGRPMSSTKHFNDFCKYIDMRLDCADFRMVSLLRTVYEWPHLLGQACIDRARRVIINFKYWMDEPGDDSMCYWSENHQILFAACEYLAGQLYPREIFTNDNRKGAEKQERARIRIERWIEYRFLYGFTEWHSNVYYEEDIAPLTILIDYARDTALVEQCKMILDLLLLDIAMHSWKGLFSASSGRCYEDQKRFPLKQETLEIAEKIWARGYIRQYNWERLSANFLLCKNYDLPEVIRRIGEDGAIVEIRDSMGLDLAEIRREFSDPRDIDTTGMFLWAMEAFTNPESISMTMKIFNDWSLEKNIFLKDFGPLNIFLLRKLRLYPLFSRVLHPSTDGIAIQRSNSYTYKTPEYMLSTSQAYHPGEFGDQQHIWQATLSEELTVFTTHPAAAMFDDNARNFSPSYWVGNGINPHSVQDRNIHLSIYRLGVRRGYLEKHRHLFTHAWFPFSRFDEVALRGRCAFGRKGKAFIAMTGASELRREPGKENELIQDGRNHFWICELGREGEPENGGGTYQDIHRDFNSFIEAIEKREVFFTGRQLTYITPGRNFRLKYKRGFCINGEEQKLDYQRLESPYGAIQRKPEEISIIFGDSELYMNLKKTIRRWR
ncbi:MAG: hypothetical protein CVV44_19435 [Spirochaetae bacterium HGW-Spirochaetae-1]|jgi:hypothetical protein|nr:MAG: hypothetical protein CVV44_19435 [Spirochaetae bacterium HGW-Spirochaetae-1]